MTKKRKIIFPVFVVMILFFLIFVNIKLLKATQDDLITGWAWSENLGWISMNCYNDYDGDGEEEGHCLADGFIDYGVDLAHTVLSGEAWSEFFGWGCFGDTCNGWGIGLTPDGSPADANYDISTGLIDGWANFPVIGADGWLDLSGDPVAYVGAYPSCVNCYDDICGLCFTDALVGGSGNICNDCNTCVGAGDPIVYSCTNCNQCYDYGVGVDFAANKLVGWAWNGNGIKNNGMGWVQFHSKGGPIKVLAPWLQTLYGDIYSQQDVGSLKTFNPPAGEFNATYLLSATGNIIHFSQEQEPSAQWLQPGFEEIEFPEQASGYKNVLGKLDIQGILAGNYGPVKTIINEAEIENVLAGKIFYREGNLNINSNIKFFQGTDNIKGSGLIFVNGDLNINSDIIYQSGNPFTISALPSVGWLVTGDINIDPNVSEIVGAFYSEGIISTGDDTVIPNQLTVKGLMIARDFKFERTFVDPVTRQSSERVIYDGRILANTPPGFEDISRSLPVWSEVAP